MALEEFPREHSHSYMHICFMPSSLLLYLLQRELKMWKADYVLNDGAPNVASAWVQDAFSQVELSLEALKLACAFLRGGGTFITKVSCCLLLGPVN